jgi:choline dehydrogenase-like flavoprotein
LSLGQAHWVRFLPSDFRVRSLDGIADDWPFTYDNLVPYYERAEQDFAVSAAVGDPACPAGSRPATPAATVLRTARPSASAPCCCWWSESTRRRRELLGGRDRLRAQLQRGAGRLSYEAH